MGYLPNIFISKFNSEGEYQWARNWGSFGVSPWVFYEDMPKDIGVDDAGNVYCNGQFRYTSDFDPGEGEDIHDASIYGTYYVSKFSPDGDYIWARFWVSVDSRHFLGMSLGSDDQLLLCGQLRDTVDMDPGPGIYELTAPVFVTGYILKLNQNGEFVWAVDWETDEGYSSCEAIDLDNQENILCAGKFRLDIDLNPGPGFDPHYCESPNYSAFVCRLPADEY